jgi:acyl carrier protein
MNSFYDQISELLITKFDVDSARTRPDASFEDLDLDSLAQVEFCEVIGERFGVRMTDDDLAEVSSIGDVIALLERRGPAV